MAERGTLTFREMVGCLTSCEAISSTDCSAAWHRRQKRRPAQRPHLETYFLAQDGSVSVWAPFQHGIPFPESRSWCRTKPYCGVSEGRKGLSLEKRLGSWQATRGADGKRLKRQILKPAVMVPADPRTSRSSFGQFGKWSGEARATRL